MGMVLWSVQPGSASCTRIATRTRLASNLAVYGPRVSLPTARRRGWDRAAGVPRADLTADVRPQRTSSRKQGMGARSAVPDPTGAEGTTASLDTLTFVGTATTIPRLGGFTLLTD